MSRKKFPRWFLIVPRKQENSNKSEGGKRSEREGGRTNERNRGWRRVEGCTGPVQKKCWSWGGSRALGNPGDWNSRHLRPLGRSSLFTRLSITPARPSHRNVSHFSSVLAPRDGATVILLNQPSVQLRSFLYLQHYFALLNSKATSSAILLRYY